MKHAKMECPTVLLFNPILLLISKIAFLEYYAQYCIENFVILDINWINKDGLTSF